jgi:hypothetical protein
MCGTAPRGVLPEGAPALGANEAAPYVIVPCLTTGADESAPNLYLEIGALPAVAVVLNSRVKRLRPNSPETFLIR